MTQTALKIFSAAQVKEADLATITREPIAPIDLMERASVQVAVWIRQRYPLTQPILVFCGEGNNGGDGLAIARLLLQAGYAVEVCLVKIAGKRTAGNALNLQRWNEVSGTSAVCAEDTNHFFSLQDSILVVDAIFGAGLSRPVTGWVAEQIRHINTAKTTVIAVDIPSGLFSDRHTAADAVVVEATHTLSFQFPKPAFLFPENTRRVGNWHLLPIGMDKSFIEETATSQYLLTEVFISSLLKPRKKFSHKGSFGHALLVAGSFGKMGAAVLAVHACLRSGTGLVTAHIPACGYEIMQRTNPEAMVLVDENDTQVSAAGATEKYNAVGIGPGIGTTALTAEALYQYLRHTSQPMVLDADALNLVSMHPEWLQHIPHGSLLTPHPKEFERLAGKATDDFHRHRLQLDFAKKHRVYVILKGAHTAVVSPDGNTWFNNTGNAGMAKGGSGDLLTGILTSLLAQGYTSLHSALIGVFVHGLAGDIAARQKGQIGMTATDIALQLPRAWQQLAPEEY